MAKNARTPSANATAALARLKEKMAGLANVEETVTYGNPTFKVDGRAFAVLDRYRDAECLWLRVPPGDREMLLAKKGWFASPYDPRKEALCCALDAVDWRRLGPLLKQSHGLARKPKSAKRA